MFHCVPQTARPTRKEYVFTLKFARLAHLTQCIAIAHEMHFICNNCGSSTLLRLQRARAMPNYTQGAAALYPGLFHVGDGRAVSAKA